MLAPFAEALALVFTRVRPWLALALLALFEAALILGAAAGRPGWDAPEVPGWGPLALPLVLLVGRVLVHAAYLGALATSGAGPRPDLESPAAHAPSETTPRLRRHAGR